MCHSAVFNVNDFTVSLKRSFSPALRKDQKDTVEGHSGPEAEELLVWRAAISIIAYASEGFATLYLHGLG